MRQYDNKKCVELNEKLQSSYLITNTYFLDKKTRYILVKNPDLDSSFYNLKITTNKIKYVKF